MGVQESDSSWRNVVGGQTQKLVSRPWRVPGLSMAIRGELQLWAWVAEWLVQLPDDVVIKEMVGHG
jgi:hypothetical protein